MQEVRFIEVRHLEYNPNEQVEGYLSEIHAYGEGFVSEVEMTSPFIPLDRPRLFFSGRVGRRTTAGHPD